MERRVRALGALVGMLLVIVGIGCGTGEYAGSAEYAGRELIAQDDSVMMDTEGVPVARDLIRTGNMTLRVDQVPQGIEQVTAIADGLGGYVEGSSEFLEVRPSPRAVITVRIPSGRWEDAILQLREVGTVQEQTFNVEDVTDQLVDLDARLRSLRAQEQTYLGILDQARSVEDVLKVQEQLLQIRTNIERLDASQTDLRRRVGMSTLQINLTQSAFTTGHEEPGWFREAYSQSIRDFRAAGRNLGRVAINLVIFAPFWIPIGGLAILAFRRMNRPPKS